MAFDKILFAVDGKPQMRAAIRSVARLALATRAEVVLLHVVTEPVARPPAAVGKVLRELLAAGVPATLETRGATDGDVAATIVQASQDLGAHLVALGSRGLTDLSGLFRGSVSHKVIALSDVPVLVVRYGVRNQGGPIRRILLAIAGGEEVPHALDAAAVIARATDAEVLVLHARYLVMGIDSQPWIDPDRYADQEVVQVVKQLKGAGVHAVAFEPVAVAGIPRLIASEARVWNADLVVVGSRRLSDLASLLTGGVDHEVIHLTDAPVLVAERPEPKAASRR